MWGCGAPSELAENGIPDMCFSKTCSFAVGVGNVSMASKLRRRDSEAHDSITTSGVKSSRSSGARFHWRAGAGSQQEITHLCAVIISSTYSHELGPSVGKFILVLRCG